MVCAATSRARRAPEWITSSGVRPEAAMKAAITKILAETERHAEEKKLEGYKATLEHRDHENERKHIRQLKRIGNESNRSWVVLISSIIAAIGGVFLAAALWRFRRASA